MRARIYLLKRTCEKTNNNDRHCSPGATIAKIGFARERSNNSDHIVLRLVVYAYVYK